MAKEAKEDLSAKKPEAEENKPTVDAKVDLSKPQEDPDVTRIDLSNLPKTEEPTTEQAPALEEIPSGEVIETSEGPKEAVEEVDSSADEPFVPLEEITHEETPPQEPTAYEAGPEVEATSQRVLPENVDKLIKFMDETGGSVEDYVDLNKSYSDFSDSQILHEYYKTTKPHLDNEEIDFLLEDEFSFDEDIDEERDIRRKKLYQKERLAEATTFLSARKDKYYADIKNNPNLTEEQNKAMQFYGDYNREQEESQNVAEEQHSIFNKATASIFNNDFKGFEYNVGEKKYRFNVKDASKVKSDQGNIENFIKKFLDKDNKMTNARGYHKALFTANNPDAIANHFYEQGKADAMQQSVAKSKNISMDPRTQHSNAISTRGFKARMVDDHSSSKLRIKTKR